MTEKDLKLIRGKKMEVMNASSSKFLSSIVSISSVSSPASLLQTIMNNPKIQNSTMIEIPMIPQPNRVLIHNWRHPMNSASLSKVIGISIVIRPRMIKKGAIDRRKSKTLGNLLLLVFIWFSHSLQILLRHINYIVNQSPGFPRFVQKAFYTPCESVC